MQLSEDGNWMWNGTEWIPANQPPTVVVQPQPSAVYEQPQMATGAGAIAAGTMGEQSRTKIVPWVGVGLIFLSLLMPYVSIFGVGVSGAELIGFIGDALEAAGDLDGGSSGDDGGGGEDIGLGFGGYMFLIAAAMLVLSPIVYLLSAILACVFIATKKNATKILAVLHFAYFGLFTLSAVLGTLEILDESFSVLGFASIGFYMASLAPGLWFVDK